MLFPGVGCFLIAAILGLFVHASNTDDINAKLGIKRGHWLSNVTAKDAHEAPVDKGAALARIGLPVLWFYSSNVAFTSALREAASWLTSIVHVWDDYRHDRSEFPSSCLRQSHAV